MVNILSSVDFDLGFLNSLGKWVTLFGKTSHDVNHWK